MYDNLPKPHSYLILNYVSNPFQTPQSPSPHTHPIEREKLQAKTSLTTALDFFIFLAKYQPILG